MMYMATYYYLVTNFKERNFTHVFVNPGVYNFHSFCSVEFLYNFKIFMSPRTKLRVSLTKIVLEALQGVFN